MRHIVRIGLGCLLAAIVVSCIAMGLDRLGVSGEGVHLGSILLGLLLTSLSDRALFWPSDSDHVDGHHPGDRAG
jgi:hypothetical protein